MLQLPFRVAVAGAALAAVAPSVEAQLVRLTTPSVTLAEEFSAIRGVRELPDGRLLVSDYIDQRVVLVDLDRGTVVVRVTKGSGPHEARLPTRLVRALGDSTLLVDLGNNRIQVLDGLGRVVRSIPAEHQGVMGVRGVDVGGALYYAVPGWAEGEAALPNDSVRIVKWNPHTDALTTVVAVQGEHLRSDIRQPAMTPRIPIIGYAALDSWVVTEGGVVKIVREGGYRVESRAPGAAPVIGPSYAYPTRAVTPADRVAFVQRFNDTSPTSGKGENGGMGYSAALNPEELAVMTRGTQFAERHPMFDAGAVLAAPGGRLWVGRPVEAGKPVLYDVFDDAGRRVNAVELPPGRRVVAVGRQSVHAVAETETGIQHLERYMLPR
jgi:hypothetical protein